MSSTYDVIVVGAGSMGMSAGYELARRGLKTLLIDAFDPPHAEGSHHGDTRLIRHVYGGGPTYVKLALRADERWRELEEASGEKLLARTGVLNVADFERYGYADRFGDAREHGVPFEDLDADGIRERWPGVRVGPGFRAMYEPNAGVLFSDKCVAAYRRLAVAAGAELLTGTFVTDVRAEGGTATVRTDKGEFYAGHAILTAGAWFRTLEPFVRLPLRAVRKVVGWFEPVGGAGAGGDGAFEAGRFPGFTYGDESGGYYGFPSFDGSGVKIGRHDAGLTWRPGEPVAPFGALPEDEGDLRRALEAFLPGAAGRLVRGAVCKYEMTPDDHFVIDVHPEHPNVLLAGGFSGHGFKFASAVGERLADRVETGDWGADLSLFSLARFAPNPNQED